MAFKLPELPYSMDALKPNISAETLEYHHGKHHNAYVTKLNELVEGTKFSNASLEEIVKAAEPGPMLQQLGTAFQSFLLLEVAESEGRRRPQGSGSGRDQERFGDFDGIQEKIQRGGDRPLRQRMGMAGAREGRLGPGDLDP